MTTRNEIRNMIRERGFDSLSSMSNSDKAELANKLRSESTKTKWIIRYAYGAQQNDDSMTVSAESKDRAIQEALSEIQKLKRTMIQIHSAQSEKKKCTTPVEIRLPESVQETLAYLIHDKDHVFKKGKKNSDMEIAFNLLGKPYKGSLYRGVSDVELQMMIDSRPINYYTSFSKSSTVAAGFGTHVIRITSAPLVFDYQSYMKQTLAEADDYSAADVEELLKTLKEEQELIMPFNTVYEQIRKNEFKII